MFKTTKGRHAKRSRWSWPWRVLDPVTAAQLAEYAQDGAR